MPKQRRGGYLGGSSILHVSVGAARERTRKHDAKVQLERDRLAAAKKSFEGRYGSLRNSSDGDPGSQLIKSDHSDGKLLGKYKTAQERAKRRAERKAKRRAASASTPQNLVAL
jgi:hypothetical protein